MGRQELESALCRDGEKKAREIWRQVEDDAKRLRTESAGRLEQQQQAAAARQQRQVSALREAALSSARQQAQRCRLTAEARLAARLKHMAEQLLEGQALADGEQLLSALAGEVPAFDWQTVVVHPRDQQQAKQLFPTADIQTSEKISAGLKVEDKTARIVIINTLEKRLEHLWPELLPEMMQEQRQRAGADETVT